MSYYGAYGPGYRDAGEHGDPNDVNNGEAMRPHFATLGIDEDSDRAQIKGMSRVSVKKSQHK